MTFCCQTTEAGGQRTEVGVRMPNLVFRQAILCPLASVRWLQSSAIRLR